MKAGKLISAVLGMACAAALTWSPAQGQTVDARHKASTPAARSRAFASNVIIPQARAFDVGRRGSVEITGVDVMVNILEQAATTTMDISLRNPCPSRLEAELIVPVPDGAVVKGFTFQGPAKEARAEVLVKDESRRLYDSIVSKMRDPALLEFLGYNLVRSSVFPVESGGTQKVRLVYEHMLARDGGRVDYLLPRSESLEYNVPWRLAVDINSKDPIATVYSPTHKVYIESMSAGHVRVKTGVVDRPGNPFDEAAVRSSRAIVVTEEATTEPGAFRLSYVKEGDAVSATFFAYPDASIGGGYFLLLAGLPSDVSAKAVQEGIKREVTLILDHSGSMRGEKIEQVREAARQVVAGLSDGESFNIVAYNDAVDFFSKTPVIKTRQSTEAAEAYLKGVTANGGTNIHDALSEALRQKPAEGTLPIVLFLTDGLPTIGQTSEIAIRDVVIKGNPFEKRVFTFGVGVDVNVPLLERVATESRATTTMVLPKEDVEVKVGQVFRRLAGPVLAGPELAVLDGGGKPCPERVRDVIPSRVPDLFEGDQLVVLGRYTGEEPLSFVLSGNYFERERKFKYEFDFEKATTRNAFVPRLWASRKIGVLVDGIRQLGADEGVVAAAGSGSDPRVKELVDEVVRLSTEFGILTEYTSFLAREGTDLSDANEVFHAANDNFIRRGMQTRSGMGAANQQANVAYMSTQQEANGRNVLYNESMERVSFATVQQVSDRAFYNRNGRWVDSRVVSKKSQRPDREIESGSEEFTALARRLAGEGRQGTLSLRGDILILVDSELILVKGN